MNMDSRSLMETLMRAQLAMAGTPFPDLKVPRYGEYVDGEWSLTKGEPLICRGYFSGPREMRENWILRRGPTIWMSISPMELESAAHHVLSAKGRVLIAGAGMGMVAWNCAIKPEVESVHIIERDPKVAMMLQRLSSKFKWPEWKQKVTYVLTDATKFRSPIDYDIALIDIWPLVGDDKLRPDMQRIAKNIRAKEYAGWGQELDFVSWCMENNIESALIRPHHWTEYMNSIGIPLIFPHPDMAHLAVQAAMQQMLVSGKL